MNEDYTMNENILPRSNRNYEISFFEDNNMINEKYFNFLNNLKNSLILLEITGNASEIVLLNDVDIEGNIYIKIGDDLEKFVSKTAIKTFNGTNMDIDEYKERMQRKKQDCI